MRKAMFSALAAAALGALSGCGSPGVDLGKSYQVAGVEAGDMLKLRKGPGTGFQVVAGLPNGTALRIHSCQQTGGTRWCKVSSSRSRGLDGYVSWAYVQET